MLDRNDEDQTPDKETDACADQLRSLDHHGPRCPGRGLLLPRLHAEIQKGLSLLDQALSAAKQDKVRKRIEIIKASLKFAQYGVESYWRVREKRVTAESYKRQF